MSRTISNFGLFKGFYGNLTQRRGVWGSKFPRKMTKQPITERERWYYLCEETKRYTLYCTLSIVRQKYVVFSDMVGESVATDEVLKKVLDNQNTLQQNEKLFKMYDGIRNEGNRQGRVSRFAEIPLQVKVQCLRTIFCSILIS